MFIDLRNPIKVVVHYILIGRMICLGRRDGVLMVSVVVCMVTHWTWPTMNHDKRLLNSYDSLSYYVAWTPNLKRMLSMFWNQKDVLTNEWDPNMVIYPYGLSHYWWRLVTIGILSKGTMISHGIETTYPLGLSKYMSMRSWNLWS